MTGFPRKVLHYCDGPFFQRSETFLYNLVSGLKNWRPMLSAPSLMNEAEFPLSDTPFFCARQPQNAVSKRLDRLLRERMRLGDPVMSRVLGRSQPEVIHAHFGWSGRRMEMMAGRRGIPLVTSFYGADASRQPKVGPGLAQLYGRLFATAGAICVEGPHLARTLVGLGCPESKIRILRIAIPVTKIKCRLRSVDRTRPVRLLHCGRFVPKKGLLLLLEALGSLTTGGKMAFELRVIGDGPLRGEVEGAIARLGLQNSVILLGSQPREVFWNELDGCDIVAVPSVTGPDLDSEGGAPTVLLEAQAAGVPIVTTNHADIPFVIAAEGGAVVADQGNVRSLAEAIQRCVAQGENWPKMGKAGREFVAEKHDIPVVVAELESIYGELIAGHPPEELVRRFALTPAQWLPKPATSQIPEKGCSLRETWSPGRGR